ncbi:hypothetical protein Ahy_B06g085113 isoform B [Arachis hypogaea]|uniref:Transposase MuDR plant domain-containing protein n=1 Tax=Arachis hypogaea TaxID=3818 RepID=A0A444YTI7_ARAHY|nr:hypothetical protein Ahy_B06g085113 isoform B [Arachis hypogaea]
MRPTTRFDDFLNSIIQKLGLQGVKQVQKLFYRISISVLRDDVKYDSFIIGSDEDLQVLFHCLWHFSEVRTPELLAKLVNVVSSSGGSNRNTQTLGTVVGSSLRPVGASSSVPPDLIADDSGDDIAASNPAGAGGGSSSGTQQYSPHFSSLDLDAMVGQQFQDKEEAVLSMKTYSIRRGVQYKVVESDYRRYVGKCSEFGNGCTWLIRLSGATL